MTQVTLTHRRPDDILQIVKALREQGLVQDKDFNFAYSPAKYDNDGWDFVQPEQTVFTFHDPKWATWFILRWK